MEKFSLTENFLRFALLGAEWVLWLLVALSVVSLYVMVERFLFFRTVSRADASVRRRLNAALADGEREQAAALVKDSDGVGARIVSELVANASRGKVALEASLLGVRGEEKIRLERSLSFLGTLGNNAPFIGLFGTVLGIIQAFHDLAESGIKPGGEQSTQVMAGISEALVATAVGLLVAIPAVVAYNVFQRRVKRILAEADGLAQGAFALLVSTPARRGPGWGPEARANDSEDEFTPGAGLNSTEHNSTEHNNNAEHDDDAEHEAGEEA